MDSECDEDQAGSLNLDAHNTGSRADETASSAVPPLTAISVCAKTSLALLAGCKSLPGKV
jgi:hypothetical protein